MTGYDEYQKLMRYKYGSHSFTILLVLMFLNFTLSTYFVPNGRKLKRWSIYCWLIQQFIIPSSLRYTMVHTLRSSSFLL